MSTTLLLLIALSIRVIDQTHNGGLQPMFGQPVIEGNAATFPDVYHYGPRAVAATDREVFASGQLALDVNPGRWQVTVGGIGYGLANEAHLIVQGTTSVLNSLTTDSGPWTLTATVDVAELAGDFNHDGEVNAADYTVWRNERMDLALYDVWKGSYGDQELSITVLLIPGLRLAQPAAIAVTGLEVRYLPDQPVAEPNGALVVVALLLLAWMIRRRKQ